MKKLHFCLRIIGLLLLCHPANAQNLDKNYTFEQSNRLPKDILTDILKRYDIAATKLSANMTPEEKKLIFESYEGIKAEIVALDSSQKLMYNDSISLFLRKIVANILAKNQSLSSQKITVITKRTTEPNAYSIGEGNIFVHLGLVSAIKTEAQMAFILCHEIAHNQLNHLEKNLRLKIDALNDLALKRKIKTISKQDYNVNTTLDGLLRSFTANNNLHKRDFELQADSLGLIYFTNAGYNITDAYTTIAALDSLDETAFESKIKFNELLSFPDFPFKNEWIAPDTTDLNWAGNINYNIPDSLKTHPDCKIRLQHIKTINIASISTSYTIPKNINNLILTANYELIAHCLQIKYYSKALFLGLEFLALYPDNIFLKNTIVHAFIGIAKAQKDYKFSKYVDLPNNQFSENYNELLRFLHQTGQSTQNKIEYFFYHKNLKPSTDAYYNYVVLLHNYALANDELKKKGLSDYKTLYGEDYFYTLFKTNF